MPRHFIIGSERISEDDCKLLSHSGVTKGGKLVLTLKVEVGGWHMAQCLEALESILAEHKAKPSSKTPATKSKTKAAPLALPSPQPQLPGPSEGAL